MEATTARIRIANLGYATEREEPARGVRTLQNNAVLSELPGMAYAVVTVLAAVASVVYVLSGIVGR